MKHNANNFQSSKYGDEPLYLEQGNGRYNAVLKSPETGGTDLDLFELTRMRSPRWRIRDEPVQSPSYGEAMRNLRLEESKLVQQGDGHDEEFTRLINESRNNSVAVDILKKSPTRERRDKNSLDIHDMVARTEDNYSVLYKKFGSHVKARAALRLQKNERDSKLGAARGLMLLEQSITKLKYTDKAREKTKGGANQKMVSEMGFFLDDEEEEEEGSVEQPGIINVIKSKENDGITTSGVINRYVKKAAVTNHLELKNCGVTTEILVEIVSANPNLENVVHLKLAGNHLVELPLGLPLMLVNLKIFDVSQNKLKRLPQDFHRFDQLETLNIQYNSIEHLETTVFTGLRKLKQLSAGGNVLAYLQGKISCLEKLDRLELDHNKIVHLPGNFEKLGNLSFLNLNHNNLETLALIVIPEPPKKTNSTENRKYTLEDWKQVRDIHTGELGYVNIKTGESKRTLPSKKSLEEKQHEEEMSREEFEKEFNVETFVRNALTNEKPTNEEKTDKTTNDDAKLELEPGWEEYYDYSSGQPYYYNAHLNETRWERPIKIQLDLSKVKSVTNVKMEHAKRRRTLVRFGRAEWTYWINSESGLTEFGNLVTKEIVKDRMPKELDIFGKLKKNLCVLLLNCNHLTALPTSIGDLIQLERLEIGYNKLVKVPESISRLENLKVLVLSENRLESLPNDLSKWTQLEVFRVGRNRLQSIPDSIGECLNLERLDLMSNKLETLNANLGKCNKLIELCLLDNPLLVTPEPHVVERGVQYILWNCRERLKRDQYGMAPPPAKLKANIGVGGEHKVVEGQFHQNLYDCFELAKETGILKLHFMGLRTVPESVAKLKRLRELRISGHKEMKDIPKYISNLPFLEIVNFAANGIEELPNDISFWRKMRNLHELDVSDNFVTTVRGVIGVAENLSILSLSGNRVCEIEKAFFEGTIKTTLTQLRVENNKLEFLPDEICELENLKVLFATNNKLGRLPEEFGKLKNLEKLHLSNNQIQQLPSSFGLLPSLQVFQCARNLLEKLEPSFFCKDGLTKSLISLNLQANKLVELPHEFKNFMVLEHIAIDLNPIRSPPRDFNGKTWDVEKLIEYCSEREKRMNMLHSLLKGSKDFTFYPENLCPIVADAISNENGYLLDEDIEELNNLMDQFVNADYYNYTHSAFEVANVIKTRILDRKNELLRCVLDKLLQLIETLEQHKLIPPHVFGKGVQRCFGRDHDEVPTYAMKFDALFNEIQPLGIENKVESEHDESEQEESSEEVSDEEEEEEEEEDVDNDSDESEDEEEEDLVFPKGKPCPSLVEIGKLLKHPFKFEYGPKLTETALREYISPYGRVAWFNAPFKFEGEEHLTFPIIREFRLVEVEVAEGTLDLAKRKENKRNRFNFPWRGSAQTNDVDEGEVQKIKVYDFPEMNDGRRVFFIAQLLFTPEEATRRENEEKALERALEDARLDLEDWLLSKIGYDRIMARSIERSSKSREFFLKIKKKVKLAKTKKLDAQEKLLDFKARKAAFLEGKDFLEHRIKTKAEANEMIKKAEEDLDQSTVLLEKFTNLLQEAKLRKKLKIKEMVLDTERRLHAIVKEKTSNRQLKKYREYAYINGLRRPWDGLNGADFALWKLIQQRKRVDKAFEDEENEEGGESGYDSEFDEELKITKQKKTKPKYDSDEENEVSEDYENELEKIDEVPDIVE